MVLNKSLNKSSRNIQRSAKRKRDKSRVKGARRINKATRVYHRQHNRYINEAMNK
jgi:hypothetical protein